MVSRGKRSARKESEFAMQGYSWEQASHSGAAKAAPKYLETKHELPSECNHCESPCAADELEITPCCRTPLCPECYELEVLENEKCPNSVCMCKLSKSLKRVSVVDSELYKYKRHFLKEPTDGESSRTAAARAPLSATAKPFVPNKSNSPVSHENAATPSFRTARASPPEDLLVSEHEFLDSEGSAPWEDDQQRKTQEARQTLEAATAHLIEVYNAMAEFLSEEERSSIIQEIVKSSGVSTNTEDSPTLAGQSSTLNTSIDTTPPPQTEPLRASTPPFFRRDEGNEGDEAERVSTHRFAVTEAQLKGLDECVSCAVLRSRIEAAVGILVEDRGDQV